MQATPRVDAIAEGCAIEIKTRLRTSQALREALMQLVYQIVEGKAYRALLVLSDPMMTEQKLHLEWTKAKQPLRTDLAASVEYVLVRHGDIPQAAFPSLHSRIAELLRIESKRAGSNPRGISHSLILEYLVARWLLAKGPIAIGALAADTGYSYPTVTASIRRLGPQIRQASNRSVELRDFPHQEWQRLVTIADEVRDTHYFADRSGQPRSVESLLARFKKMDLPVALGGVHGARHYFDGIDILGSPRLDLTIHCPDALPDLRFVTNLDAALEPAATIDEPPRLAVHHLRRPRSLFARSEDGIHYADPAECLLDLQGTAGLQPQAVQFLAFLSLRPPRRG